ncbi:MAG: nuclear transport factor 2 family protein, partial [Flavobacteriaceae bacterium]
EQLKAYNNRDIEAFMATYSEDIKLFNFPNQPTSQGKDKMKEDYNSFFENVPNLHCEVKKRIVIGNKVIDEEYITANDGHFSAVAIYEVENGKISRVTFIK